MSLRRRIRRLLQHNRRLAEEVRAGEARTEIAELRLKKVKSSFAWRYTRILRMLAAKSPLIFPARQNDQVDSGLADHRLPHVAIRDRGKKIALIIDYRWPRPDQDSGSIDAMNLVDALFAAQFAIAFFADAESSQNSAYRSKLEDCGVLCLGAPISLDLQHYLEEYGDQVQLCILSRVYAGGIYLDMILEHCSQARVIFNPVDLHFLREERQARLLGGDATLEGAAETRTRELLLFSEADATIVVSKSEQELLKSLDPSAYVVHLPLARPISGPRTTFEQRQGIGFVGNFEHAPNLDAIRFFLAECWPSIRDSVPDCEFLIAGKGLSEGIVCELGPGVAYLDHIPDISAWLDTIRLTVAPLRFGAGAKGKIASSLACGVPCVATSLAVEGMELGHGRGVLLADAPSHIVGQIRLAYSDEILWRQLSDAGLAHAREALSVACYRHSLMGMLEFLDLAVPNS